jgi:hypothetical protein
VLDEQVEAVITGRWRLRQGCDALVDPVAGRGVGGCAVGGVADPVGVPDTSYVFEFANGRDRSS